jgi:predicted DNA-binding transcriptional regulator AlpA
MSQALLAPASPIATNTGAYECADISNLLKISERQVWRLNDSGRLPGCIRIGRSVRWSARAIDAWIEAGCPTKKV